MAIPLKDHKRLWAMSGGRCAICKVSVILEDDLVSGTIIGEECHIVAEKNDGPRGISPLLVEERNKYENLIILCRNHHKEIDDNEGAYPVDRLKKIKSDHEREILEKTGKPEIPKSTIVIIDIITEWEKLMDLTEWKNWTSFLVSEGQPRVFKDNFETMAQLPEWCISRFWPNEFELIKKSMYLQKNIIEDIKSLFSRFGEDLGKDMIWIPKFYSRPSYEKARYARDFNLFEFVCYLIVDLVYELTREMNRLIDIIRSELYPHYRSDEGRLMITTGPNIDMTYKTFALQYKQDQEYPGLQRFIEERQTRDHYMGHDGQIPEAF
jgi:hypothetical protein